MMMALSTLTCDGKHNRAREGRDFYQLLLLAMRPSKVET
jgi:hypothetical protein